MKSFTRKRGLIEIRGRMPESANEQIELFKAYSGQLDRYLSFAKERATEIVSRAGIDADSLLNSGDASDMRRLRQLTEAENADTTVALALEVLVQLEYVETWCLWDPAKCSGLVSGIGLAQAIAFLTAHLAWEPAVTGFRKTRRRSAIKDHVKAVANSLFAQGVPRRRIAAETARLLQRDGHKASERTVREIMQKLTQSGALPNRRL